MRVIKCNTADGVVGVEVEVSQKGKRIYFSIRTEGGYSSDFLPAVVLGANGDILIPLPALEEAVADIFSEGNRLYSRGERVRPRPDGLPCRTDR